MNRSTSVALLKSLGARVAVGVALVTLLSACGPEGLPDADMDGVPDSSDWCATVVEEPNGFEDEDGCPDVVPEEAPEPLDLRMAGSWYGVVTVRRPDFTPLVYGSATSPSGGAGIIFTDMREHDAAVLLPCAIWYDSQSQFQARTVITGGGRSAAFDRPARCSGGGPATCRSNIEYTSGSIHLDDAGHIRMEAAGLYSDCNVSGVPTTIALDASIQR